MLFPAARGRHLEDVAVVDHQREHDRADRSRHEHRAVPAKRAREPNADQRSHRIAQVPRHAVPAVGEAQARRTDARVEDREIARMEHAVADAADDRGEDQRLVAARETDQDRSGHTQRYAEGQHPARAEPVGCEPRQRLADPGYAVIEAGDQPQRRVAHAEIFLEQRKERRDEKLQEVRHRVRGRHQADRAGVRGERWGRSRSGGAHA